ncbi:unnamed protein product [Rotaria sp. Silwood2]|nr:unnamed protein product [Rotaria sp. Silwood2]CAF4458700.1 unnamed protein product [Rotaria sp. Silwood2]
MATTVITEDDQSRCPMISSAMLDATIPIVTVANSLTLASTDHGETMKPIVSFGLVSDIQYADKDDHPNYSKTRLRRYRNALKLLDEACDYWIEHKYGISFVLQLGDLIDGASAADNKSQIALNTILAPFSKLPSSCRVYHIWGNHELYNFPRAELLTGPLCSFDTKDIFPGHYGTFQVCPGLRVIALDTFEFSVLGVDKTDEAYIRAKEFLKKRNPNEYGNDYYGLYGDQRRFVEFNGGVTPKQLDWLQEQLTQATKLHEKVIVIGESH